MLHRAEGEGVQCWLIMILHLQEDALQLAGLKIFPKLPSTATVSFWGEMRGEESDDEDEEDDEDDEDEEDDEDDEDDDIYEKLLSAPNLLTITSCELRIACYLNKTLCLFTSR